MTKFIRSEFHGFVAVQKFNTTARRCCRTPKVQECRTFYLILNTNDERVSRAVKRYGIGSVGLVCTLQSTLCEVVELLKLVFKMCEKRE